MMKFVRYALLVAAAAVAFGGCAPDEDVPPPVEPPPADVEPETPEPEETEVTDEPTTDEKPVVIIETSMGRIKAELWPDAAPVTVANFLAYVDDDYYDGLIFHRVMPGFMIQGGGFSPDMRQKPARPPIPNEASAEVPNDRGTLAMARTQVIDSATSQFFINLVDNDFLNHRDRTPQGFGYCVFGKVIEGMDVVDEIAGVRTTTVGPHQNVPAEPVLIESIRRAE